MRFPDAGTRGPLSTGWVVENFVPPDFKLFDFWVCSNLNAPFNDATRPEARGYARRNFALCTRPCQGHGIGSFGSSKCSRPGLNRFALGQTGHQGLGNTDCLGPDLCWTVPRRRKWLVQ